MGLKPWNMFMLWMKKEDAALTTISASHTRPRRRCSGVPLRASNIQMPSRAAGTTVATWIWMASGASRRGASVMA